MTASHRPPQELYLELLKRLLTRTLFEEAQQPMRQPAPMGVGVGQRIRRMIAYLGRLRRVKYEPDARAEGRDWPQDAETMIGLKRMDNIQACVIDVLRHDVPGDLIETGVWRGGATIFMRAILEAYADPERVVWVADSFQGLPEPDAEHYPWDRGVDFSRFDHLVVSLEDVKANFERYGLLDARVRFLPGWFRDTVPGAPIERLSVLRVDGDLYESTMVSLRSLYDKVSVGGYVIIDDYGGLPVCKAAVDDFRAEAGVTEPIQHVDWTGVFWQRRG
ncbi:MAG: TylF/MycF/NovP-related O-methyltransferase [Actinomycetota bacterium]